MKEYFIPVHQENNLMHDRENVKQVSPTGAVKNISDIVIDFKTIAVRLGNTLRTTAGGVEIFTIS